MFEFILNNHLINKADIIVKTDADMFIDVY